MIEIFRFVSFASGAILAVLIILTVYDEDVLNVEHMLTVMTSLGIVLGVCRSLIPDEVKENIFYLNQIDYRRFQYRTPYLILNKCYKWFLHKFIINQFHGKIMHIQIMFKLNLDKCFN